MGEQRFRIWFGERAAGADELRRVEEIEVIQEMDAFWEARVRMVLCLDADGSWLHWPGEKASPFSRVRIELDPGDGRFIALIDGPLAAIDAGLDAQPGRSAATIVVRDDSAFLDRDEEAEPPFEGRNHGKIARAVFGRFKEIASTRIDATQGEPEFTTWRGTALQFLRELGRINDRHAYVLPGEKRGASVGCFLADPTGPAGLAPLVLVGPKRNLATATIGQDPDGGERTRARVLRFDDGEVTKVDADTEQLGLMRNLPARPADLTPRRLLHPQDAGAADPAAAAAAQTRRNNYPFQLTAQLVPGCYGGVLAPYQKVRVDAGATPHSGDYLVTKVVHRITASVYTQQFEAKGDSLTEVPGKSAEALDRAVKTAIAVHGGIF
jgi:hypothetical protein